MFGIWQLVLILLIILVIFGAGRIPNLMGDIGKGIKNFRKNVKDDKGDAKNIEDQNQDKR